MIWIRLRAPQAARGHIEHGDASVGSAVRFNWTWFFCVRQKAEGVVPLLAGLALMIFPYFIANTIALVTLGIALIAIPYFIRL
jgi:hypothetical protein